MASSLLYFVEGYCEKSFIRSFMFEDGYHFKPGKIEVLNLVNEKISKAKARTINKETTVAIVFDTDVENMDTFEENIRTLKTVSQLTESHIIFVPSIKTFEDELVYSCANIKNINDLFNTKSVAKFKKKFIAHTSIVSKLNSEGFDFNLIWSREAKTPFDKYKNTAKRIKCK